MGRDFLTNKMIEQLNGWDMLSKLGKLMEDKIKEKSINYSPQVWHMHLFLVAANIKPTYEKNDF